MKPVFYKMELHTHTKASDGSMTPAELVDRAVERGYDGIVVTDHNTVFGAPEAVEHAREFPLLVIRGIEWTTFWGHVVVSGGKSPVDWRSITQSNLAEKLREAADSGDLVTVAHPTRIGGCICTGCHFDFPLDDWSDVHALEVFSQHNPVTDGANALALKKWRGLLDKGEKIAAVYGYDWHSRDEVCPPYAATYIGIDGALTSESFVAAVKNCRTYISVGLRVVVEVTDDSGVHYVGEKLKSGRKHLSVFVEREQPFAAEYEVSPQKIFVEGSACSTSGCGERLECDVTVKPGYFFVRVEGACGKDCGTLSVTSPFFVED